jgi:alkylhydroperoxidase/carboxymuconolactone decarboxylase family protein YurZ
MSITPQERELVIIGTAVACGCKTCIRQNMLVAKQLHVADKDIAEAIAVAIDIRRHAANDMEDFVSSGLVDSTEPEPMSARDDNQRLIALVSVGAAFAVNCVSSLSKQVTTARAVGIDDKDLNTVVGLSSFIKAMAASHVERLMSPDEFEDNTDMLAQYATPFGPERCAWTEVCKSNAAAYLNLAQSSGRDPIEFIGAL